MRLDKFLALQGLGSRKEVKALLRAGRVAVDGMPAGDPGAGVEPARQTVSLDGTPLVHRESLHIMLNKPVGVVTAATDPRHRTVMALLPGYAMAMRCMPIGRLDLDTEGLLLLSTDGALAHRLLAPKRCVDKVYRATVDAALTEEDTRRFAEGIQLSDFMALPAALAIDAEDARTALLTVHEGKFHQVKRMFGACGKQVLALKRLSFGGIALDEALAPGAWRPLTEAERLRLYKTSEGTRYE